MKTEPTILSLSVYLTNLCNLRCKHCFLRASPEGKNHLTWKQIKTVLDYYRSHNYQIVEFTGGEACLSPYIRRAVTYARQIGFPSVGINTNAVTTKAIDLFSPAELDKITVSLDGVNSQTHDLIRGEGAFERTMATIRRAIDKGFNVETIFTVNSYNQGDILKVIRLLDSIGVSKLSLNYVSPIGNAKDNSQILISPEQWVKIRQKIEKVNKLKNLTIRYPLMFVTPSELKEMKTQGYHCILTNSSKTEIRPDGNVYHCCLTVEEPKVVGGQIKNSKIIIDNKKEINFLQQHPNHPCPARTYLTSKKLIPVCVYYKKLVEPSVSTK